jgi:hypothetical protein
LTVKINCNNCGYKGSRHAKGCTALGRERKANRPRRTYHPHLKRRDVIAERLLEETK